MEIEQGEEADCEEGKEVGFQNESGTIPSWQKLPKKYIPCHYHFRRPAKAEEDEADGEMSAMLLAMQWETNLRTAPTKSRLVVVSTLLPAIGFAKRDGTTVKTFGQYKLEYK